jgi:hypothetical protein
VVVYYIDKTSRPVARLDRLSTMSDGLKAILAMYALQAGAGCETHDSAGNLQCTLTSALGLGSQCSESHVALVRQWFKDEIPKISGHRDSAFQQTQEPGVLESMCYTAPFTATFQHTWQIIRVTQRDNRIVVDAMASWLARDNGGRVRYHSEYELGPTFVKVVSHTKQ